MLAAGAMRSFEATHSSSHCHSASYPPSAAMEASHLERVCSFFDVKDCRNLVRRLEGSPWPTLARSSLVNDPVVAKAPSDSARLHAVDTNPAVLSALFFVGPSPRCRTIFVKG